MSVSQTVTDDNTVDTWYDCPTDFVENDKLKDTDMHVHSICNATTARKRCKQTAHAPTRLDATDSRTANELPSTSALQTIEAEDGVRDLLTIPSVSASDYESDPYLSNIFAYLTRGTLPIDNAQARITLLLSEDFIIQPDGLLYRISVPRNKKQARVISTELRLALPQKYLAEIVEQCHNLGHFSKERNFQFLRSRFYAKNLFDAVNQFT